MPKQRLLFSCFGQSYPLFPGFFIDNRFVGRVLVFERIVSLASQVCIGFDAQDLLQRRDSTGVPWLRAQSTDGFPSHTSIGIFERHLDEQTNKVS